MVSFRNVLFFVTAALATVSEARSIGHKRYGRIHARHAYHNETAPAPVEGYPSTGEPVHEGYPVVDETEHEGYPTVPHGTGIDSYPTTAPIGTGANPYPTALPVPGHEDETVDCSTYYETKTVTYTLGNGHAVTTTFTQTNIVTNTHAPVYETPVGQAVPTVTEEGPAVTVVPIPAHNDYGDAPLEPEWSSTSTFTIMHTVTRIVPYPDESPVAEVPAELPAGEAPCVVATVTVTAGAQETVTIKETIKETVKEYITVTATGAGPVETVSPIVQEPVEEPVEVPAPGYDDVPVEDSPVEESPVEESPVEESPVEETPVEDSPVEEYPEEYPAVPTPAPVGPPYGNFTGNHTLPTTTYEHVVTVVPVPAY